MRKKLLIAGLMIITGLTMVAFSLGSQLPRIINSNWIDYENINNNGTTYEKSFDIVPNEIIIKVVAAEKLNITFADVSSTTVYAKGNLEKFSVNNNNSQLVVNNTVKNCISVSLGSNGNCSQLLLSELSVTIPATFSGKITIDVVDSAISVTGQSANRFDSLDIDGMSLNVTLNEINTSVSIDSASLNVKAIGVIGELDVDGMDIDVSVANTSGELEIDADGMDVTVDVVSNENIGYKVKLDGMSVNFNHNGHSGALGSLSRELNYANGNPRYDVTINGMSVTFNIK